MQKLYNWLTREDGQTMAEYGVVLAVITIAVFGALALLSGNITNALTRVAGYITESSTKCDLWRGLESPDLRATPFLSGVSRFTRQGDFAAAHSAR